MGRGREAGGNLVLGVALLLPPIRALAADCARPTDVGGADGYDYGAAKVSSFGDEQVLVWYTTTGEHSVNPQSSRRDEVPDDVATVVQVTGAALTSYAAMGYRSPVADDVTPSCGSNGGDARLDVYLVAMRGADGMAVPELQRCTNQAPRQCASYLYAKADFAAVYGSAELGIRTVLPHETFHAVQNAYDVEVDRFWAEGSAQWAAKTLDPTLLDLEHNLPAFFKQTSRSLDAPANGVTAALLYGSAIWPVFLSQRYGDDVVRAIFEEEALTGGSSLAATDAALQASYSSSLALEYPQFSAWNVATGARAGFGGYTNAASYPLVSVTELVPEGSKAITSGLASFFYHTQTDVLREVTLETDSKRNSGLLIPVEAGVPRLDKVAALPAQLLGEGLIVVSGITTAKTDAPFTVALSLQSSSSGQDGGGCALASTGSMRRSSPLPWAFGLLALLSWWRSSWRHLAAAERS